MGNPASIPYPKDEAARRAVIMRNSRWVQGRIYSLEDAQARELKRLLEIERDKLSQQIVSSWMNQGKWTATDPLYGTRTEALMQQISRELEVLVNQARSTTLEAMTKGYQGSYYGNAWILDQAASGVVDVPMLPVEAVRAALLNPYGGTTFLDRFADARDDFVKAIRRAITQSQIAGDSIPDAIKRLSRALGVDVKGIANHGLRYRLEMIARTEILRASNMGAMQIYSANRDVLKGWEFIATKSERTCEKCGHLDGVRFTFRQRRYQPPLHPNCRCSLLPVLIDEGVQKSIAGKRITYDEWRRRNAIYTQDGQALQ